MEYLIIALVLGALAARMGFKWLAKQRAIDAKWDAEYQKWNTHEPWA
jgi:uncharacterized membrane-anchored protein YhcB (DUF1043 family)